MKMIKKLSLLILAGACLQTGAAQAADNETRIGQAVGAYLAIAPLAIFAHEFGHWAAAKAFGETNVTIHLNASGSPTHKQTFQTYGNTSLTFNTVVSGTYKIGPVHIHSLNPLATYLYGRNYITRRVNSQGNARMSGADAAKEVIIKLAGPLAGIAASCALTAALYAYCFKPESPEHKKILLAPCALVCMAHAAQLLPIKGTDGWGIKEAITSWWQNKA